MNESSLAVLHQSARPALAAGSRECSRRILRQVTNRYTRRLSAVTGDALTPRQALAVTSFALSVAGVLILAECIPAVTVCTLVLAASARVLASSETPSVAAKQKSDIHPVEKD